MKNIAVRSNLDIGPDIRYLIGDELRVTQILVNLLHNALKFTRYGSIDFTVKQVHSTKESNKITLHFAVKDTGIGISKENLKTLFVPFMQIDSSDSREHDGTGLGLAICKMLVEMMHGRIEIASEYGVGTTVWFEIPFEIAYAPPEEESVNDLHFPLRGKNATPSESQDLRSKFAAERPLSNSPEPTSQLLLDKSRKDTRILIVEDNLINQKIVKLSVQKMGFAVFTALNGSECLDYLKMNEIPDLILMDCQMPIIDGYSATSILRQHVNSAIRELPVIAMTASVIVGDREKCLAAGMDDYLAKPFKTSDLEKIIVKWLLDRQEKANSLALAETPADDSEQVPAAVIHMRSRSCSATSVSASSLRSSSEAVFHPRSVDDFERGSLRERMHSGSEASSVDSSRAFSPIEALDESEQRCLRAAALQQTEYFDNSAYASSCPTSTATNVSVLTDSMITTLQKMEFFSSPLTIFEEPIEDPFAQVSSSFAAVASNLSSPIEENNFQPTSMPSLRNSTSELSPSVPENLASGESSTSSSTQL